MAEATGATENSIDQQTLDDLAAILEPTDDLGSLLETTGTEEPVLATTSEPDDNSTSSAPAITEEELNALREKAIIVDQFQADPEGTLTQLAQRLGLQVAKPGADTSATSGSTEGSAEEKAKKLLDEKGYGFMADAILEASKILVGDQAEKSNKQAEEIKAQLQAARIEEAKSKLTSKNPNWSSKETEMTEVMNFLRGALNGGSIEHPKFGSVLDVLYKVVEPQGVQAGRTADRFEQALRNRITGGNGAASSVSAEEQISKTESIGDKLSIALRASLNEMTR